MVGEFVSIRAKQRYFYTPRSETCDDRALVVRCGYGHNRSLPDSCGFCPIAESVY